LTGQSCQTKLVNIEDGAVRDRFIQHMRCKRQKRTIA